MPVGFGVASCKLADREYSEAMTKTAEMMAFGRGVRPVAEIVFPEKASAVLGFRPAPELLERIEELAGKSSEGRLTQTEREE